MRQTFAAAWLDAVAAQPEGDVSEADVRGWVDGPLRRCFPFQRFFAGYGRMALDRIEVVRVLVSGYDADFVAQVGTRLDRRERGCFAWWLDHRQPFLLDPAHPPSFANAREIEECARFGLGVVAAHGVVDSHAGAGTYFSFAGLPASDPAVLPALRLIAPILHALLLRALPLPPAAIDLSRLTQRQREVLALICSGLDDKSIARALGLSDETVGAHARAIYARLGVHKRAELIARARPGGAPHMNGL